ARNQIAAKTEEAQRQLLDPTVEEPLPQQPPRLAPADQSEGRDRIVVGRIGVDEATLEDLVDRVRVDVHRDEPGDQRAEADAADAVELDPRSAQLVEHTEVRKRTRAASRHDD